MSDSILRVAVEAIEMCGPGIANWSDGRAILTAAKVYIPGPVTVGAPAQLSAAERRRAIPAVRLALAVGLAAVAQAGLDPKTLPVVFASSGADGETISAILEALATLSREVSPTRFHNSVHNAPSGYWGIAVQSQQPVTSLSAYDASFTAGLLEACVQVASSGRPVLLIAYDLPYPEPLESLRHIESSFGVALVLSPAPSDRAIADLQVTLVASPRNEADHCSDPALERLRHGNPAARSLPLLAMLAAPSAGTVRLDLSHGAIEVSVLPC